VLSTVPSVVSSEWVAPRLLQPDVLLGQGRGWVAWPLPAVSMVQLNVLAMTASCRPSSACAMVEPALSFWFGLCTRIRQSLPSKVEAGNGSTHIFTQHVPLGPRASKRRWRKNMKGLICKCCTHIWYGRSVHCLSKLLTSAAFNSDMSTALLVV
jgi:hypothetical protein